jgi:hypothetical protein
MTPEEREARQRDEEEQMRAYEEARQQRRMLVNAEFDRAYRTYTTTSYDINFDSFFTIREPDSPPPTLNERYIAAMQEVNRCAQRNDHQGQLTAMQTARRLRQEIQRASLVSTQSFI